MVKVPETQRDSGTPSMAGQSGPDGRSLVGGVRRLVGDALRIARGALVGKAMVLFGLAGSALVLRVLELSDAQFVATVLVLVVVAAFLLAVGFVSRWTRARLYAQASSGTLFRDVARAFQSKLTRRIQQRSTEAAVRELEHLVRRRRQPLEIILEDVTSIVAHYKTEGVGDARPWVAAYLAGAVHLSEAQRERTVSQVERRLAEPASRDRPHYFVTYGHSRLVVDALEKIGTLVGEKHQLRVLSIKDEDYARTDTSSSLKKRLGRRVDIRRISLGDFVGLVRGSETRGPAVEADAQFEVVIGCERIDPEVGAYMAVRSVNEPPGIETLLNLRRNPVPGGERGVSTNLVSETYKIRRLSAAESASTGVPSTFWRLVWYLLSGIEPAATPARLVEFPLRTFDQIITDRRALECQDVKEEILKADLNRLADWRDWLLPRRLAGDWRLDRRRFDGITHVLIGIDALVESRLVDYGAFATVLAPFHTLTEAEYDGIFDERTDAAGLRALLNALGDPERCAQESTLLAAKNREMQGRTVTPRSLPAREGALQLLEQIARSELNLSVLTAYDILDADQVLTVVGLNLLVDRKIQCKEDDKSSETTFRELVATWKISPQSCLLIDDSETTVAMAERVGWSVFRVSDATPLTQLITLG